MAATRTSLVVNDRARPETEKLPDLLSRLGDDALALIRSQFALFKVELKEEANDYVRGAVTIAVGSAIAMIGFALLNVAIAFGVSTIFVSANFSQPAAYALGFVVTGIFYLVIGGIVVLIMKNRLAKKDLVPQRSVEELRKDKEWLKNEL